MISTNVSLLKTAQVRFDDAETSQRRKLNEITALTDSADAFSKLPKELLFHTFTYLSPTDICLGATVTNFFRYIVNQFERDPAYTYYWKHFSKRLFPESCASLKSQNKDNWFDFFKNQKIAKTNFLTSNFKSRNVYTHNLVGDFFFAPSFFDIIQDKGIIATITVRSIKIWDFEDSANPLKFELFPTGPITSAVLEENILCAYTGDLVVWDLHNEASYNPDPWISITPPGQPNNIKLIDKKLFFSILDEFYIIDLKSIKDKSAKFHAVASNFQPIDSVLGRSHDKLIGSKTAATQTTYTNSDGIVVQYIKRKIIVLDLKSLEVLHEFEAEENFNFEKSLTKVHCNKLIALKVQYFATSLRSKYKFFNYNLDDQNSIDSDNEEELITSNPISRPYIFNNTLFCFESCGHKASFDIFSGKMKLFPIPLKFYDFQNPINIMQGIGKIINGICLSKQRLLDLSTGKIFIPHGYEIITPLFNEYRSFHYEWVGSKLILGHRGKIEVIEFGDGSI